MAPQPLLIVVTGRPGSGKTTLAHSLARVIRCPAICRDEIKEGLINTSGPIGDSTNDIARQTYEIFFDTLTRLLSSGVTLVADAAFQHKLWAPQLEPLREITRMRIVLCDIDPRLARARHIQRDLADPVRQRFHDDPVTQAARAGQELPMSDYDPPHLEVPTLRVDTSNGYQPDLEAIVTFGSR